MLNDASRASMRRTWPPGQYSRPQHEHMRNGPPAARELGGTWEAAPGGAGSSGALSTRQRVNDACCQSMPRLWRNVLACRSTVVSDRRSTRTPRAVPISAR